MSKNIKTKILAVLAAVSIIAVGCAYAFTQLGSGLDESRAADSYKEFKADDIAHGWDGTCPWSIDKDGTLTLWEGTPVAGQFCQGDRYWITEAQYNALTDAQKADYDLQSDGTYWYYGDPNIGSPWRTSRHLVKRAVVHENVELVDATALFSGLPNMTEVSLPSDMSSCTNMLAMFDGCTSLVSIDFTGRNISKVTSMQYMFRNCSALQWCYINDVDTRNVKSMRFMFQDCIMLKNVDLTNFNTDSLNNIAGMFYGCRSMISIDISSFTLPSGIDYNVGWIFQLCSSVRRINFGNNIVSANDHKVRISGRYCQQHR